MHLPPEFELVAACCRWPPSPARGEALLAAADGVDWALVARIAGRHRVEGLVWNALRQAGAPCPPEIGDRLKAAADRIAGQIAAALREHVGEAEVVDLKPARGHG